MKVDISTWDVKVSSILKILSSSDSLYKKKQPKQFKAKLNVKHVKHDILVLVFMFNNLCSL